MPNPYDTITGGAPSQQASNPYDTLTVAPKPTTAPAPDQNPYDAVTAAPDTTFATPAPIQAAAPAPAPTPAINPDLPSWMQPGHAPSLEERRIGGINTAAQGANRDPVREAVQTFDAVKTMVKQTISDVAKSIEIAGAMTGGVKFNENGTVTTTEDPLSMFTPQEKQSAARGAAFEATFAVPELKIIPKGFLGSAVLEKAITIATHGAATGTVYGAIAPTAPGQSRLESIGENLVAFAWQAPIFAGVFKALGWGLKSMIPASVAERFRNATPADRAALVEAAARTEATLNQVREQGGLPGMIPDDIAAQIITGHIDNALDGVAQSNLDERVAAWTAASELGTAPQITGLTPPSEVNVPGQAAPQKMALGLYKNTETGKYDFFGYRGTPEGQPTKSPSYGGLGIFMTALREYARQFGEPMAVRTSFDNPVFMDTWIHLPDDVLAELRKQPEFKNFKNGMSREQQEIFSKLQPAIEKAVRNLGYDGIVVAHGLESAEIVALHPDRVYVAGSPEATATATIPDIGPVVESYQGLNKNSSISDLYKLWRDSHAQYIIDTTPGPGPGESAWSLGVQKVQALAKEHGLDLTKLKDRNVISSQLLGGMTPDERAWGVGLAQSAGNRETLQRMMSPNLSVKLADGTVITEKSPMHLLQDAHDSTMDDGPTTLINELIRRKINAAADKAGIAEINAKATGMHEPAYGKVLDLGQSNGLNPKTILQNHVKFLREEDAKRLGISPDANVQGGKLHPQFVKIDDKIYKVNIEIESQLPKSPVPLFSPQWLGTHIALKDVTTTGENPLNLPRGEVIKEAIKQLGKANYDLLVYKTMAKLGDTSGPTRKLVEENIARQIVERKEHVVMHAQAKDLIESGAGTGVDPQNPLHQELLTQALYHEAHAQATAESPLISQLSSTHADLAKSLEGIEPQPVSAKALERPMATGVLNDALVQAGQGDVDKALLKLTTNRVKLPSAPKGLADKYTFGEMTIHPAIEEIAPWDDRPPGNVVPKASDDWAIMSRILDRQHDEMAQRIASYGRGEGGLPPKATALGGSGSSGGGGISGALVDLMDFARRTPRQAFVRVLAGAGSGYLGYESHESDDPRTKALLGTAAGMLAWIALGPSVTSRWAEKYRIPQALAKMSDLGLYMRATVGTKAENALRGATDIFQGLNYAAQAKGEILSKLFKTAEQREALARGIEDVNHPALGTLSKEQLDMVLQEHVFNQQLGDFLVKRDILDEYRTNYIRHLYPPKTYDAWKSSLGNISPGGFTKSRIFDNLAEAEAWAAKNKLEGPVLDGVQLQVKHLLEVSRAVGIKQLTDEMKNLGLLVEKADDMPADWRQPKVQQLLGLRAPDAVATAFERIGRYTNPFFDSGFIKAVDTLRSYQMRAILMYPWVHGLNALRAGLAIDGTGAAYVRSIRALSRQDPGVYEATSYGLDISSRPDFALGHSELFEKVIKKVGFALPDAITGPAASMARWADNALWSRLVPGAGYAMHTHEMLAWAERTDYKFQIGSPEYAEAARKAADLGNRVEGKIPQLMQDPGFALVMRFALFAPQWLRTRIALTTSALGDIRAILSGELPLSEARMLPYKMKSVLIGMGLTYIMSMLWTGRPPKLNPNSQKFYANTGIKDQNGRELGVDFAGWWQDDLKLWSNPSAYFMTRLNPMLQVTNTVLRGRDTYGRSITGTELGENVMQQLGPIGGFAEGAARVINSGGKPSDADVLKSVMGTSMVGNVATLPREAEVRSGMMARRLLRNQDLPQDDDRVYELQQIILQNARRGQPLIGGDVISWLAWQQRGYKKSFPAAYLWRHAQDVLSKLNK